MNRKPGSSPENNRELLRYAGLGTQLLAAIGLAVFAGIRIDKSIHSFPLLSCVLPLLVLAAMFYKLFRETGKKTEDR